jgi:death-on-curing protein
MRYLTLRETLALYHRVIDQSGGSRGVRDLGAVESALAQPQMTYGGFELYPTIAEEAVALGFSLIMNHPLIDGNKRVGHAAMEVFLMLNGYEIEASVEEQERVILQVASGKMGREAFTQWLQAHIRELP